MLQNRNILNERLNNYVITVGANKDGVGNAICVADGGKITTQVRIENTCNSALAGRYVHVKLRGPKRILTLCEIEVYSLTDTE